MRSMHNCFKTVVAYCAYKPRRDNVESCDHSAIAEAPDAANVTKASRAATPVLSSRTARVPDVWHGVEAPSRPVAQAPGAVERPTYVTSWGYCCRTRVVPTQVRFIVQPSRSNCIWGAASLVATWSCKSATGASGST